MKFRISFCHIQTSVLCNNLYKQKHRHFSLVKEKRQEKQLRLLSYRLFHCKQVGTCEIQYFLPPFSVSDSDYSRLVNLLPQALTTLQMVMPQFISHPAAYKALLIIISKLPFHAASQMTNPYSTEDLDYEGMNPENLSHIELTSSQLLRDDYLMIALLFSYK